MCMSDLLFTLRQLMDMNAEMNSDLGEVRPHNDKSPATSSESDKGVDCSERKPRRRRRRGKHRRKWKPYSTLTEDEKKALEARDNASIAKRNAQLASKACAPWNTTQFIIEDRGCPNVNLPTPRASRTLSLDDSVSEEDIYESPDDDLFRMHNQIEEEFEIACRVEASERLQGLRKEELVEECLSLEKEARANREEVTKLSMKVTALQADLESLQRENDDLLQEQHTHTLPANFA